MGAMRVSIEWASLFLPSSEFAKSSRILDSGPSPSGQPTYSTVFPGNLHVLPSRFPLAVDLAF